MGYNKRNTTLILIMTIVSVLGLSVAFAAFSSTLTVKSNATITPDSGNFKVVFSSSSTSLSTTNVSVSKTGNSTAGTPTIDNSCNPTIKDLSASFTAPGEKVEYTFYARNEGSYDAYLSSVVFDNINGKSVFKECVAGSGTDASLVASACNGIKVTTTVLSTSYTDTTLNITNHVLKKNNSEVVKVTIEYTSGAAVADGPFTINFGKIYLTYGSTSLSGMPTIPEEPTICKSVTTATTGNVPTGSFNYGDEYTCQVGDGEAKTFFVLETSGDNVSLIMNANVGSDGKIVTSSSTNKSTVAWVSLEDYIAAGGTEADYGSYGNNNKGPITANKALKEYTSTWTNLSSSQITLPSAEQIATASGQTFNNSSISGLSTWLYDYLDGTTHPVSGVKSYWTITPHAAYSYYVLSVNYNGYLSYYHTVNVTGSTGVRPVITISKSDLS